MVQLLDPLLILVWQGMPYFLKNSSVTFDQLPFYAPAFCTFSLVHWHLIDPMVQLVDPLLMLVWQGMPYFLKNSSVTFDQVPFYAPAF